MTYNLKNLTVYGLLFLSVFFKTSALTVGQPCVVQLTGHQGICKESSNCQHELELSKLGLKPTVCERQGNKLIICCAVYNNSPNPNPFSLTDNFDNGDTDSDVLKFPDDTDDSTVNTNLRKSEQKCLEYSRILTDTVQVIPLIPHPKPVSINVAKCDNSIPLIVGGSPARPAEFPHMAALGYFTENGIEWKCGGTLISEEFVVTAAHCAKAQGHVVRVRLGGLDLTRKDGEEVQELGVAEIIIHPQYRPPLKYNDIALLRLSRPVVLTRFITPACLRTAFYVKEPKALVTGWGNTEYAGSPSTELMKVVLTIVHNDQCNKLYHNQQRWLPDGIRQSMLCAGEKAGGKDACQGDSGGPLQIARTDNPCLYDIVGVTSFGKGCANPNTVGVYTRISEFVPWIERIVWS